MRGSRQSVRYRTEQMEPSRAEEQMFLEAASLAAATRHLGEHKALRSSSPAARSRGPWQVYLMADTHVGQISVGAASPIGAPSAALTAPRR
jgi:hypothetical protein